MNKRDKQKSKRVNVLDWVKQQNRGFEPTCIKLPEGVELAKFDKPGIYKWDFMLYRVGKHNPRADEGMEHFERQYEAHRLPTPSGTKIYPCRFACFHTKCAVCDWLKRNGGNADKELVKRLRATTRHLWVINDKPGDTKNALKVYDSNHYNRGLGFGEMLTDAIIAVEQYANFADLEEGYTLQLNVKEQPPFPGGSKYNAVTRIDFLPRKYTYPESMIDAAPCLDDCIVDPGYDEIMTLLEDGIEPNGKSEPSVNGTGKEEKEEREEEEENEEEENEPKGEFTPKHKEPPPKQKASKPEVQVGDQIVTKKWGKCYVTRIKNGKVSMEDPEEEMHTISLEDLPNELKSSKVKHEEEEEEEEPEETEDEDEGDDEPVRKRK